MKIGIISSRKKEGYFLVNDLQTQPSPFKKRRFDFLVQIVEKHSEANEKRKKQNSDSIFRVIMKVHQKLTIF